ncbi:RNA polymerase sigma factor [Ginsengibacter hankyongi]|uniref:RNA polymerase sigma factor n=1 Tax=Ginsengibacter hankyongi TaxID=2607284 RepID=A0A5J5IHU4_9BACT|nr:RNA polymerase sigma factor [Ginsengibacter hankyongi]
MEETELIERLKKKDRTAFKNIVETWQDLVYNTAIGILQNAEDAEDVTQETFMQAFESVSSFKGESKFSTWLYRITVSKAMDHIRKKKRKKRFAFIQSLYGKNDQPVIDPPDFFHPGISMENKENAAVLFKAMEQLPPNQKTAFVFNKVEGLSYIEIGDVMKITESAVDALLHRAKANLKKILKDYYTALNKN